MYLTATDADTPALVTPKLTEATANNAFPVLRWHDANAARHRYTVQLSANGDFAESQGALMVSGNVWQPADSLLPGRTYRWRVKATDVLRNTESDWSVVGAFTVPQPRALLKASASRNAEQEPDSIDALGHWHAYWAFLFQTVSRDRDVVREGSYSFRIDNPYDQSVGGVANWRGPWGTRLPRVQPGEKLRFTVWAKATGESIKPGAAIWFLDKNGKRHLGRSAEKPGAKDWSPICVEARAPEQARSIYLTFSAKGRGTAWLDDFALERADSAQ